MNTIGGNGFAIPALPSCQRFDTDDPLRNGIDDRLEKRPRSGSDLIAASNSTSSSFSFLWELSTSSSKQTAVERPSAFARYKRKIRFVEEAVDLAIGASGTDTMDADARRNNECRLSRIRSAFSADRAVGWPWTGRPPRSHRPGARMANSSPPNLQTMSPGACDAAQAPRKLDQEHRHRHDGRRCH